MLLSYDKTVTLQSQYPPEEVVNLLCGEIKEMKWYDILVSHPFSGEVTADSFRIRPTGRSSLLIEGSIIASGPEQSRIVMRFTNGLSDKIGRIIFISGSVFFLLITSNLSMGVNNFSWPLIGFCLMPALMGVGVGNLNCVIATSRATMRLKELLAAKETV